MTAERLPVRRRLGWSVAAAIGVAVVASSVSVGRAGASPPVIEPGRFVQLSDPGVELTTPADGRLRGEGVALMVTGAALTSQAGQGSEAVSAGPGQHLIVFGVRRVLLPDDQQAGPPPSLVLVVAGGRRTIDLSSRSGGSPAFFAASIPANASDVALELSSGGYSQRFSLLTLSRPRPDPVSLYRDAETPDVVSDVHAQKVVPATVAADGFSAAVTVEVQQVRLSWFSPAPSGETASSPDQAFLAVHAQETPVTQPDGSGFVDEFAPMPADHVHLVLPDGSAVTAAYVADSSGSSTGIPQDDRLWAGTYYFAVPANLTAATLRVDAIDVAGAEYPRFTGSPATVSLPGYDIPLTLPPPPSTPSAATTPTTMLGLSGTPGNASAGSAKGHSGHSSGPWVWLLVLAVAAVAVVAGGLLVARQRRKPAASAPPDVQPPPVVTPTVPVFADAHPAGSAAPVPRSVLVLGPVELAGVDTSSFRSSEIELAVYLALHTSQPVTTDKLRDALGVSAKTVRSYASHVRQALGAERLPSASDGKYEVSGLPTDWERFQELTTEAERAADASRVSQLLEEALRLVRGVPFADSDYEWPEGELLIHQMEKAVADAANRMAAVALELRRPDQTSWAIHQGLVGLRYPDHRLLADRLRVGATQGASGLTEAWREDNARLSAVDDAPSDELIALYDDLRRSGRVEM
jgi:hypothetical protein